MNDVGSEAERLENALSAVMRAIHRQVASDPLSELPVAQLRLLRSLGCADQSPSALAEQMATSVSAVTQMANRLEAAGFIEREDDPDDRRVRRLSLSSKGAVLVKRRKSLRIEAAGRLLSRLTPDERDEAIKALEKLAPTGSPEPEPESLALIAELEGNLNTEPENPQ